MLALAAMEVGVIGAGSAEALPMSFAGSTTLGVEYDAHWSSAGFSHAFDRHNGLGLSVQYLPANTSAGGHNSSSGGHSGMSTPQMGGGGIVPLHPPSDNNSPSGSHAVQGDESFLLLDWTRLVRRWNLKEAQANLWFIGGVGGYHASGTSGETTRIKVRVIEPDSGATNAVPAAGNAMQLGGHGNRPTPRAPVVAPGRDQVVVTVEDVSTPPEPSLRIAASPGVQFDIETSRLRFEGRGRLYLAPGIQRSQLSATAGVGLTPPRYEGVQPWLELQVRALPGVIDGVELIPKLRLLQRRLVIEVGYSSLGSVMTGFSFTL